MENNSSLEISQDDIFQFREIGKIAYEGIRHIIRHSNLQTRFILGKMNPSVLPVLLDLTREADNDYDELKDLLPFDVISGYIKMYCWLAINYYSINTFIPVAKMLMKDNAFANASMPEPNGYLQLSCLTRRELYTGLQIIGENERRSILSKDTERFDELFQAVSKDDFIMFSKLVDETNLVILSAFTIFAVIIQKFNGKNVLRAFVRLNKSMKDKHIVEDVSCELLPSHISYWEAYTGLKQNFTDENDLRYVIKATNLFQQTQTYIGEMNALLQFILSSGALGRAKRQTVIEYMGKSDFLRFDTSVKFIPEDVTTTELMNMYPIYTDLAVKFIRQEMKQPETFSEYEDSSVGINLDSFLRENFRFTGQKHSSFKDGEYKYFSRLCNLITSIKKDRRGSQRYTYALLYLFFPVHRNQNSIEDVLAGRRLNEKYLQWKEEPKDRDEAFQRLIKHFPSLTTNQTDGQPSLPSRSREVIEKWIKEGQTWLTHYLRETWTEAALERTGLGKHIVRK